MTPIHELLNRIQWDEAFSKGDFVIGYYDRMENKIIYVPFLQINFEPGDHFFIKITNSEGCIHEIPYHRVKEVYKNGELIWHRAH